MRRWCKVNPFDWNSPLAIAWSISIVGTLIILLFVDKTIGLRVSAEEEATGLDLSQHGEEGYDFGS